MDRATFLEAARASVPTLVAVALPGFAEPVWIRRMTVAEARQLATDAAADAAAERTDGAKPANQDARVIATMVRDQAGELLFDREDEGQMLELQAVVEASDARMVQALLEAANRLNEPAPDEADASGN